MSGEKVAYSPPPKRDVIGEALSGVARGTAHATGAVALAGFTVTGAAARGVARAVQIEVEAAKKRAEARERERRRQIRAQSRAAQKEEELATKKEAEEASYTDLLNKLQGSERQATETGQNQLEKLLQQSAQLTQLFPEDSNIARQHASLENNSESLASSPPLCAAAAERINTLIRRSRQRMEQKHIRTALAARVNAWLIEKGYECIQPFTGLMSPRANARYGLPGGGGMAQVSLLEDGRMAFRIDPVAKKAGTKLTPEQGRQFKKLEESHCKAFPKLLEALNDDGFNFNSNWKSFDIPIENRQTVTNENARQVRQATQQPRIQKQQRHL